jgi:LemA protein
MRRGLWIGIGALVIIFLIGLLVFGSYVSAKNQMVQKRENITSSWAEVNNQLQRRADLIPNLVETVKGYAKQETTVFGDIANARAGLLNAHGDPKATMQANGALDGALGRLLMLTENYPDLKSNANFQRRLSDELAGTENRIAVARKRYNGNIQDYNTFIQQFPNSIWAGMAGFSVNNDYFQASPGAQNVPKVSF